MHTLGADVFAQDCHVFGGNMHFGPSVGFLSDGHTIGFRSPKQRSAEIRFF
jgi:hypothetical protein